jgi:hypothetical protein
MTKSEYNEALKDVRWQKFRHRILGIRGFRCEKCGTEERQIHLHHISYRRDAMPWEYADSEMLVVCCRCHAEIHAKPKAETEVFVPPVLWQALQVLRVRIRSGDFKVRFAQVEPVRRWVEWLGERENIGGSELMRLCREPRSADEFYQQAKPLLCNGHPLQALDKEGVA